MATDLPYRPCVGVCLINRAGLIFGGERNDTPGAWQMPQGGIDKGEAPLEAALRELEEETSVPQGVVTVLAETADWLRYDLPPDLLGKVWKGKYRGQEQKWFCLRLDAGDEVVDLDTSHPEFGRWQWMKADDLTTAIVPFKRSIYEAVFAEFHAHVS